MSGGSFNYLAQAFGVENLLQQRGDLEQMCQAIAEYADEEPVGAALAVVASRAVHLQLNGLDTLFEGPDMVALRKVWHAVEWHHSADWCREDAVAALRDYANLPRAVAGEAPMRHADAALAALPGGAAAWPHLRAIVAGAVAAALAEAAAPPARLR